VRDLGVAPFDAALSADTQLHPARGKFERRAHRSLFMSGISAAMIEHGTS
jgi:hypothetical protein